MSVSWNPGGRIRIVAGILAVALASAAPAADWSQALQVNVELSNFDFSPKTLNLHHGQPYRLHLTNRGSGGHNFSAPAFFKAATIAPQDAAAIVKGGIDLDKGESRDVLIIPASGQYKLKCTHFMHTMFGMKGSIVVD